MTAATPPRTEAERAGHAEQLLADIASAVFDPARGPYATRALKVRDLLLRAGYHQGQVDDDGAYVTPPHDGCHECKPYPLAEAAGPGRDGDGTQVPTLVVADGSSRCSACGHNADPHEHRHRSRLGVTGGAGCGVKYAAVACDDHAHTLTEQRVPGLAAELGLPYTGRRPL